MKVNRYRFISPAEWAIVAHGVGGVKDAEHHLPVHPTSLWWPPKGMPRGLYKDVVYHRVRCFYFFHAASIIRWGLMVLQLLVGATLTAIGSLSFREGTTITVLGAVNTATAGFLALLHNSGLPDRYRNDMVGFDEVEDHIRQLLDTGIAPADKTIDQILAECFEMYRSSKATVNANMPVSYTTNPQFWRQSTVTTSSSHPSSADNVKPPGLEECKSNE